MKPACQITHPQITAGACPWCDAVLGNGEFVPGSAVTWDIRAMLSALGSDEEHVRGVTVKNLEFSGFPLGASIPLLSKSLTDRCSDVRDLAEESLCRHGNETSHDTASQLEAAASGAKDELALRILLLGYYFLHRRESDFGTQSRQQHILWIIQHYPELNIAGRPYAFLIEPDDEEAYAVAKTLWLKQVASQPSNMRILRNAAKFFCLNDWEISEDLLGQASILEPNNHEWHDQLATLYSLHSREESSAAHIRREQAFREYQIAAQLELGLDDGSSDDDRTFRRILRLIDLAKSAFDSKHLEEAVQYATELLERIMPFNASEHTFPIGNAIHHGNLVLGRFALQQGNIELAKKYLLAAGRTPGSPQLDSFGPSMALAKELLERDEQIVVFEYFDLCKKFWIRHSATLEKWAMEIKAGNIPDFGPHLAY